MAVIDSGVSLSRLGDLGALWSNPPERADGVDNDASGHVDDQHGWDFVADDNDAGEQLSGAQIPHGAVIARVVVDEMLAAHGVAPHVIPLRVSDGRGPVDERDLLDAFAYAQVRSADVILMALGGSWDSLALRLTDSVGSDGPVVVVAAGNAGEQIRDATPLGAMCLHERIICVASNALPHYPLGTAHTASNYGPETVDVSAFGGAVPITAAEDPRLAAPVDELEGTSVAAAVVAGGVAAFAQESRLGSSDLATEFLSSLARDPELAGYVVGGRMYDTRTMKADAAGGRVILRAVAAAATAVSVAILTVAGRRWRRVV